MGGKLSSDGLSAIGVCGPGENVAPSVHISALNTGTAASHAPISAVATAAGVAALPTLPVLPLLFRDFSALLALYLDFIIINLLRCVEGGAAAILALAPAPAPAMPTLPFSLPCGRPDFD